MKRKFLLFVFIIFSTNFFSQGFIRSELSTTLTTPWEMTYGPDGFLWLTESGGKVSRVDPSNGNKTVVYTAPDYFGGAASEQSPNCFTPAIGAGALGLALHPDFMNPVNSYIYYVYSYNSGTTPSPATKFKIVRLTWNASASAVTSATDIVTQMPTGYDHLGGRLMAIRQNSADYLYFTVGDNGVSEDNAPTCYNPQSGNPNNFVQDINYKNGKIHRFNIDGTIPSDNPVAGNSLFTRGHRNPQGLMYNPNQNILYSVEHGDRTDDEINILFSGKNYGWKWVRGYHADNNYPGEASFVSSYTTNPAIVGDGLKEAFYSWCAVPQPTTGGIDWCTIAPSDGIYYNSTGIPNWNNSLLVVTLKDGSYTDMEMYRFQLNPDGISLAPSTTVSPNPEKWFAGDQSLNGRLRDIAISPDGKTIYLINNGGTDRDKITVYTYDPTAGIKHNEFNPDAVKVFPVPANDVLKITSSEEIENATVLDPSGKLIKKVSGSSPSLDISGIEAGLYFITIKTIQGNTAVKRFVKQ